MTTTHETIMIRPLRTLDEMRAAVDLQRIHWGEDDEAVIPAHMLYSLVGFGGHVLAAIDGEKLVGVLIGFLGTNIRESHRPAMANLLLVSKRMVVLPAYRNRGIAYRLKLAQRDLAIQQGIRLVTWTFDPLLATNAHLNIRKLGAVSQVYHQNYYGTQDQGGLTLLGVSDRLQVEWFVTNRRVEERISGSRGNLTLRQYLDADTPILNPTLVQSDETPWPSESIVTSTGTLALLEIPTEFLAIARTDAGLATAWRTHTRELFQGLFPQGFVVTDFVRERYQGRMRAFYLLSLSSQHFDFSLN